MSWPSNASARYADWKAPDEDGQILNWPGAEELLRQTRSNQEYLSKCEARVQGVRLAELRSAQRRWLGQGDAGQPLIAAGHQTELYHPGVWAKDVLIDAVARKVGGKAWHLAIDTDAPKHLHLRWPGGAMPITDDPDLARAPWAGLLEAPSPAHIAELEATFAEARLGWDFEPMVGEFLAALKRQALEQPSLSRALVNAIHQLDWGLGLRHHALLVSPIWESPAYLVFVHHLLARAGEFAGQYNSALAEYRREAGIVSSGRPMPDLRVDGDEVEAAFWLDDVGVPARRRLVVRRVGRGWMLDGFEFDPSAAGDGAAERLAAFLRERRLRITPRALTLTLFFRLLLADQFVHGIGGARYDRVTDRIIHSHFGIEPPRFAVTTATLYFPAARGQRRISLRPLLQEGRRILHGSFSREKRGLVSQIEAAPRKSAERRRLFNEMHAQLARQAGSPRMLEWQQQLEEATRAQMRQKAVFDRELFYAIQPEERLRGVIARCQSEFARVKC